jgi:hypothetical protein
LGGEPLFIGNRSLHFLLSRGLCVEEGFLTGALRPRVRHISLHGVFAGQRRRDLSVGLIDSGSRPLNP